MLSRINLKKEKIIITIVTDCHDFHSSTRQSIYMSINALALLVDFFDEVNMH